MSQRSEIRPYQVITNGNVAGTITSLVTIIQKVSLVNYTFSWSGTTPVGTLKIQVSNDYAVDATGTVSNTGNWSDVSFTTGTGTAASVAVSGNTGTTTINSPLLGAYAIRAVYTASSGTGTLQGYVCGKVA